MSSLPFEPAPREDLLAWLRFSLVEGIRSPAQRKLLAAFRSPQAALEAPVDALAPVVGPAHAQWFAAGAPEARIEAALRWLDQPGHHLVALGQPHYPQALLTTPDPPTVLYVRGRLAALNTPALAIVGSRNASTVGERDAHAFAAALSGAGLAIVSGLAAGIDAAAHRGALAAGGLTVAVMGTGPDRVYPDVHAPLADEITAQGAVITEFPLGMGPVARNFPMRNRIISGLSRGVLVVEAALLSGSLITAREGADQGREVFALPGSIHSPRSKGCHALIRAGAKLVECADDILEELDLPRMNAAEPSRTVARRDPLLGELGFAPTSIDQLAQRTGVAASDIASRLTQLELSGRVTRLPGGLFQQVAR